MPNKEHHTIAPSAYIAKEAVLIGDITIGENTTILFFTVIRGDEAPIRIGQGSNIQENCTIHVGEQYPVTIGDYVTIGHNCVVHGCEIGDGSLIGMHSTIMDGAKIGKRCLVGAGSLVTGGTQIPDGVLVLGSPARVKRPLMETEIAELQHSSECYMETGKRMKEERG